MIELNSGEKQQCHQYEPLQLNQKINTCTKVQIYDVNIELSQSRTQLSINNGSNSSAQKSKHFLVIMKILRPILKQCPHPQTQAIGGLESFNYGARCEKKVSGIISVHDVGATRLTPLVRSGCEPYQVGLCLRAVCCLSVCLCRSGRPP